MKKKVIAFIPMVLFTVWTGVVFFKTLSSDVFDWRLYASLTGFAILLLMTIWFGYLLKKRNIFS